MKKQCDNDDNQTQWLMAKNWLWQFPWAGCYSSSNFGCHASFLQENKNETTTVQKEVLWVMGLIGFLCCELILFSVCLILNLSLQYN
jgi:hypothetical protein